MNGCASTGRAAGGIRQRVDDGDDDNNHNEEWSLEHPELSSPSSLLSPRRCHHHQVGDDVDGVVEGDHHSRTTKLTIIGTSRRGSFGGNTNAATATATPSIMKEKTKMSKTKHQQYVHCHGENLVGDHPSHGVNLHLPLKKTPTSIMNNDVMTSSPNTTIYLPRMQYYYPPPPYGKRTAHFLPSPTRTTTTSSIDSPPPPPPRSSSSKDQKITSPPPPPPPVWRCTPPSRRSSTSSSSSSSSPNNAAAAAAAEIIAVSFAPPPPFSMEPSALLCSVINDTSNNKFKKKEVTFAPSTTGGMMTSSTIKDIDTGTTSTATATSACNKQNEIHNSNNDIITTTSSSSSSKKMMMMKSMSNPGSNTTTTTTTTHVGNKKTNATITSKHPSTSVDNNSDLLKRVSTVCDSVYTYLEEFDSRKNNNAITNPNNHKNKNNISKKYSSFTSNPEKNVYTRRHTTDNNIPNKPASSSSSNVDNVNIDTKGRDQKMNDLSFTPGSINNISPLVNPRRNSTGTPVSRRHSDSSANAMSRITTATTSRLMGSTTTTNNNNSQDDGTTSKSKTKGRGSPTTANCRNDRSFLDVPSRQDLTSSLQSVVRGRQRVRSMYSSLQSTTVQNTVPSSSATTPLSHQQPKQQQQQYPRSASMDANANMIRRGGGGGRRDLQRRSNDSSKYIIDNLTKQVNTDCRNFQRSSSEGDGDDARMNSLITTKSLLRQLRTSLDDAVTARRGVSLCSRKKRVDHHKLGNSIATDEVEIATEKRAADEDVVAQQGRCKSMNDSFKSSSSDAATATGGIRARSAVGLRRRESACSSTESLSAADTSSDCESLISVLRSYRGEEKKGGGGVCERKKGRKKSLLDIGGLTRRRGSSLSRNAAQILSTMDSPVRHYGENNGSNTIEDDPKANMVYDIPFDPITGKCHHHSTVQMAVREEDDDDENKKEKHANRITTELSGSTVVCGWRIVRTTCPKCKYNY